MKISFKYVLFTILQIQNSHKDCWFLTEKLSQDQIYLDRYLEAARKSNVIRRFKISNRQNFFVVRCEDEKEERITHLVEPQAQLYDHTEMPNRNPTTNEACWRTVHENSKVRSRKYCLTTYGVFLDN